MLDIWVYSIVSLNGISEDEDFGLYLPKTLHTTQKSAHDACVREALRLGYDNPNDYDWYNLEMDWFELELAHNCAKLYVYKLAQ